jgi:hypothetical protein
MRHPAAFLIESFFVRSKLELAKNFMARFYFIMASTKEDKVVNFLFCMIKNLKI